MSSFYQHKNKFETLLSKSEVEKINRLKKHNKILDKISIYATLAFFILLLSVSEYFYSNYLLIVLFCLLQGLVLHTLIQMFHEYGVHSNQIPSALRWLLSCLSPVSLTQYKSQHLAHHRAFPNTALDPDLNINIPRSKIQKFLSFTALGIIFQQKSYRYFPHPELKITDKEKKRIRLEHYCFYGCLLITIILFSLGYSFLLFGWLLPLIFGVPIFTGIRLLVEHGDTHAKEFLGTGTNLRVPIFLRLQPFASVYGQGHIVHHYFPSIPWYNIAKACRLLEPYFLRYQPTKHFWSFFLYWLMSDQPLRSFQKDNCSGGKSNVS